MSGRVVTAEIAETWSGDPLPPNEIVRLTIRVELTGWSVEIDAPYFGDPAPIQAAGYCEGLWEFEVVELFLVSCSGAYMEFEFGPHGHFLVYELKEKRKVHRVIRQLPYWSQIEGERWRATAHLSNALIPKTIKRWNAFSISGLGDQRRHSLMKSLPGSTPDFHQPEYFLPWLG